MKLTVKTFSVAHQPDNIEVPGGVARVLGHINSGGDVGLVVLVDEEAPPDVIATHIVRNDDAVEASWLYVGSFCREEGEMVRHLFVDFPNRSKSEVK